MKSFLPWLVLILAGSIAAAASPKRSPRPSPPPPAPPTLGPIERVARPVVLVFVPQPAWAYNPFAQGLVGAALQGGVEARYMEGARKTATAIRKSMPSLNVGQELRSSLRCGEPGSLCTEMVVLDSSDRRFKLDESVIALLSERQWQDARVLSVWWEGEHTNKKNKRVRLATHVASTDVTLNGMKLKAKVPVYASYFITRSAAAGAVHEDEWEFSADLPREAALRTSLTQLEPMLQFAYSWGANNDPVSKQRIENRTPVRYMKSHGIECKGVLICYIPFDSIVGDRNWTWQPIEMLGDIKTYKAILKSRSNKAP